MLLKGDMTMTIQKWGSTPPHAGLKMGLASDGQFSTRVAYTASDSKKMNQTRRWHFCITDETACDEVDAYRSGNKDRLPAKWIYIL